MATERKISYIYVVSGRDDDRVVLTERHEDHPNGEVFVAGKTPVRVAKTLLVALKLRNEELVEVEAPKPAKAQE